MAGPRAPGARFHHNWQQGPVCAPGPLRIPPSWPPSPVLPAGLDSDHVQGQGFWVLCWGPLTQLQPGPP